MSQSTLERDFSLASIVTRPAQHTKALELDRPELAGMVPSTTHCIPTKLGRLKFSWWEHYYGKKHDVICVIIAVHGTKQ
jgi:hypothetical protein